MAVGTSWVICVAIVSATIFAMFLIVQFKGN